MRTYGVILHYAPNGVVAYCPNTSPWRNTKIADRVTCKRCLKAMAKAAADPA